MTIKDRDYQARDKKRIKKSWQKGSRAPLYVLPTGGGKTHIFSSMIKEEAAPAGVIAHRQELVEQTSLALGRQGLPHSIVGPDDVVKRVMRSHVRELGRSFYNPTASTWVAGVDTLIRVDVKRDPRLSRAGLIVQDEAHHVLKDNKWGKAAAMFPGARFLLVTATPERADGKGLGVHAAGIADDLIEGPGMGELIERGYLTPFRIFGIPSSIHQQGDLKVGASGDYTLDSMRRAFEKSGLVGDIVKTYLQRAKGLRGVTFVPDVEDAHKVARAFVAAGVPAVALSAKTPGEERAKAVQDLAAGRILQIVNVDLLGEGFDCPGIECVSFGRPTESYAVYAQQFGRALRLLEGKQVAFIFDHVGNVLRHGGPPTQARVWSLDGRSKGAAKPSDAVALRYCVNTECALPFERFLVACPFCGTIPTPPERREPVHVDGDLYELDPETLDAIQAKRAELDKPIEDRRAELFGRGMASKYINGPLKAHRERQAAQETLRAALALWGGKVQAERGIDRRAAQKLFFLTYGVDVLTATTLHRAEAETLTARIMGDL